jgi:hypothetical protein
LVTSPARHHRHVRSPFPAGEQPRERAGGHDRSDLVRVPRLVELVGVDVERGGRAGVAEDPADLRHVEPQVDDQVAGERVAQRVKPRRGSDASASCRALERPTLDVAVTERRVRLLVEKT